MNVTVESNPQLEILRLANNKIKTITAQNNKVLRFLDLTQNLLETIPSFLYGPGAEDQPLGIVSLAENRINGTLPNAEWNYHLESMVYFPSVHFVNQWYIFPPSILWINLVNRSQLCERPLDQLYGCWIWKRTLEVLCESFYREPIKNLSWINFLESTLDEISFFVRPPKLTLIDPKTFATNFCDGSWISWFKRLFLFSGLKLCGLTV